MTQSGRSSDTRDSGHSTSTGNRSPDSDGGLTLGQACLIYFGGLFAIVASLVVAGIVA